MSQFTTLTKTEKWLCVIATTICLYYSATFILLVLGNFWPGPLFDYWVALPSVEKYFSHELEFSDLASAHNNAHRILIPRLLFILDHQYFAGSNVLPVTVSLLCKAATLLLFNIVLKNQKLVVKTILNALIFAAVLNAGNVYNIIFNFDIQWDLVSVFACYAIFFYIKALQTQHHWRNRILAYLFLCLAFFSHAGSLSLPLVFMLISVFNKKIAETALNLALIIIVFYIHSRLPFADPQNPDALSALITLFLQAPYVLAFITKFISGSLIFYLGPSGYYFSAYAYLLFIGGIVLSIKNRHVSNNGCDNYFLYFAVFLFLMITTIAAARTMFTPNVWAASRFQTTVLLFILCIHIHAWLCVADFFKNNIRVFVHIAIALQGFGTFFLIHYFTYNIPYKLSNVVFFSHAYMLTHERSHFSAPRLLLWIHDEDVIATTDPFFRKHGFAWYANKQVITNSGHDFVDAGKQLIASGTMPDFQRSCSKDLGTPTYKRTQEGAIEFSVPISNHPDTFSAVGLQRKTWYALDANGVVSGFAYVFVSETGIFKTLAVKGYSLGENVAFFAETDNNYQPTCLYSATGQP